MMLTHLHTKGKRGTQFILRLKSNFHFKTPKQNHWHAEENYQLTR